MRAARNGLQIGQIQSTDKHQECLTELCHEEESLASVGLRSLR